MKVRKELSADNAPFHLWMAESAPTFSYVWIKILTFQKLVFFRNVNERFEIWMKKYKRRTKDMLEGIHKKLKQKLYLNSVAENRFLWI